MISAGRTMHQAITDGTAYQITHPTILPYGYFPPAAETPAEVLACAKQLFRIPPGTTFRVSRIIGGEIGGRHTQYLGALTA